MVSLVRDRLPNTSAGSYVYIVGKSPPREAYVDLLVFNVADRKSWKYFNVAFPYVSPYLYIKFGTYPRYPGMIPGGTYVALWVVISVPALLDAILIDNI